MNTYAPPEGYTPRLRIGPSVLDQASRCMRSWGLRYLLGYDAQDPTWAEIAEHVYDPLTRLWRREGFPDWPSRKRSTALGTEAHAIVEGHYMGTLTGAAGAAKWASFPGQVAQAWLDVMPSPEECDEVYTELGVCLWNDDPENPDDPPIEGTSDLLLKVKEGAGVGPENQDDPPPDGGWLVGDWKTTKSTTRGDFDYQPLAYETKRVVKKDREGNEYEILVPPLFTNRQAVIYPLAAMRRLDLGAIPGRWAYSITDPKKRREARATDFVQTRENAEALVKGYFAEARVLKMHFYSFNAAEDPAAYVHENLPANTDECDSYGGCPHAWDRGGACTARRSLGARIAAAGPCTKPAVDVPLEALLKRSVDVMSNVLSTTPVSSWKAAAARFAAQRAQAPAGPPPEDNPPLAAPIEHNGPFEESPAEGISLDPQPELPTTPAADKPKGRRGRPPGSKNKTASVATEDETPDAPGLLQYTLTQEQLEAMGAGPNPGPEVEGYDHGADKWPPVSSAEPTFRDFTLSEIAAAAKATGAEISIHFSGKGA